MEPLTSCQYSAIFCSTKNSQSKMYTDVHFQNGHGCPSCQSAASFSLEKLVVEPCPRRYAFRTAMDAIATKYTSMYIWLLRVFPWEKLDTAWNHWHPVRAVSLQHANSCSADAMDGIRWTRHRIEAVSFLLRVWYSSSLRREEKRCGIFAEARKRYKRIAWFLRKQKAAQILT